MSDKNESQFSESLREEVEALVEQIAHAIEAIDSWEDPEKHPVLRTAQTLKKIEAFEKRLGGKLPEGYRCFLSFANGMEGATGYDWLIRGTSEVRLGIKFRTVEKEFLSEEKGSTVNKMERDAFSPCSDDSLIIASNFVSDVAFLRRNGKGDFNSYVELYRSPDLLTPVITFDSFVEFLNFVLLSYKSKVGGSAGDEALAGKDNDELIKKFVEEREGQTKSPKKSSSRGTQANGTTSAPGQLLDSLSEDISDFSQLSSLLKKSRDQLHARAAEETTAQLTPEMAQASKIVEGVVQDLLDNDLLELVAQPNARADLEDYMLKKLITSSGRREAVKSWFEVLLSAREIEDLYGTDSEVEAVLNAAFKD